jgi:uridine phosphorylase
MQAARVLNFEMETAALFTIAGVYGLRAGGVCAVFANRVTRKFSAGAGEMESAEVATEAVKVLAKMDKAKQKSGKRY